MLLVEEMRESSNPESKGKTSEAVPMFMGIRKSHLVAYCNGTVSFREGMLSRYEKHFGVTSARFLEVIEEWKEDCKQDDILASWYADQLRRAA